MAPKRAPSEAEQLASLAARAHTQLADAGRALHDDVGPLLAGAGLFLSTAPDDPAVKEALSALDQAMERVRALSQQLNSSPADRMGLHKALLRIAEQNPAVEIAYTATAKLPRATASASICKLSSRAPFQLNGVGLPCLPFEALDQSKPS